MSLSRRDWDLLDRFLTEEGRCNIIGSIKGLTQGGADFQTMEHIVHVCPLRYFLEGMACLHNVGETGFKLLRELDLALWSDGGSLSL